MERDLGQSRISAQVKDLEVGRIHPFEEFRLPEVAGELRTVVLDYNFDTFSFFFELFERAEKEGSSLPDTFINFDIDSLSLARKYHGANCTGLSMMLRDRLRASGIASHLTPSYGNYFVTEEADTYSEIRTIDLVGVVQEENSGVPVFLAPGLTIDKPIMVAEGYQVESFGNRYLVTKATSQDFEILTIKPNSDTISRIFVMQEVLNPDESLQKNLIRTRTRYQMTRQYEQGTRDYITFDFPQRTFRIGIGGQDLTTNEAGFLEYVHKNGQMLEDRFRNPEIRQGFERFTENIDNISEQLLLPEIQNILTKIWKSS